MRPTVKNNSANSCGIGLLGVLGVAFVVLKLTGAIDWSWWWVTSPFWAGPVFVIAFAAVIVPMYFWLERKKS
jgi:phosphoglycerol transferase MdoB-like AlkP superfamily enzyme